MNKALYNVLRCIYRAYSTLAHPVKVVGRENIPESGKMILCANHQSFEDPLLLATYQKRMLHFMAKKEIFKYKPLAWFFSSIGAFPVARGENDLSAIRTSFKILSENEALSIFPEGKRFKDGEMHAAKNGACMIALRTGAAVIPAYINGEYRFFRSMTLRIGAPLDFSDLGGKCDQAAIEKASVRLRDAMLALSDK